MNTLAEAGTDSITTNTVLLCSSRHHEKLALWDVLVYQSNYLPLKTCYVSVVTHVYCYDFFKFPLELKQMVMIMQSAVSCALAKSRM